MGWPARTLVSQVPQNPSSQEDSTSGRRVRTASRIEVPGRTTTAGAGEFDLEGVGLCGTGGAGIGGELFGVQGQFRSLAGNGGPECGEHACWAAGIQQAVGWRVLDDLGERERAVSVVAADCDGAVGSERLEDVGEGHGVGVPAAVVQLPGRAAAYV